ncbi:MAG: 50S ribosomal protein L35 [Rhodospirillales bacterium]|nr:50S ribosomal protein L35 [Alphaproteobacteria bacterium]USO05428.1 MAG: 50S ribosomal protein L35 [Rhodospirillales bacterium]
MPKMKTKSGAKKRFRVTSSGKVKVKQAKMRHMQMNKPKSMKRKAKGQTTLCDADERIVLCNWLPYSRKKKKASGGVSEKKEG